MIVHENEDGEGAPESFADFEARAEAGTDEAGEDADDDKDADEAGDDKDADEAGDDEAEDDKEDGDEEDGEDDKPKKKTASAEERIRDLNRKWRSEQAARETDRKGFEARLAALEGKKPLTDAGDSGKEGNEAVAPDPKDLEKYPLGALDDRYIQDSISFHAEQQAVKMVDSLLQRQEQSEEQAAAEALLTELHSKADNVVTKGLEIHDDYESVVVEAGLRGDYDLTQITFEAAAEAVNGAQILYDLAMDPAEATRVAQLPPIQQLKFVMEKDAELAKGSAKAKLPGAKPPPAQAPRGGRAQKTISPATTNFKDFERLADETLKN